MMPEIIAKTVQSVLAMQKSQLDFTDLFSTMIFFFYDNLKSPVSPI